MIRAIKYGAAAGFTLPLSLRWKIRRQSPLLASVSPSRLTEEIFKIIRSSSAAIIAGALESCGLYEYLQPNASRLMKEKSDFRSRYLGGLEALNKPGFKNRPGETLAALIQDYLEDETDWEGGIAENYKNTFSLARAFVLPMNPPRVELDNAVRLVFAEHGITIKKSRFLDRKPPREKRAAPPEGRRDEDDAAPEPRKNYRRRRRRKKAGPGPDTGPAGEAE
jgi:poly(A) polymerase